MLFKKISQREISILVLPSKHTLGLARIEECSVAGQIAANLGFRVVLARKIKREFWRDYLPGYDIKGLVAAEIGGERQQACRAGRLE